MQYFGGKARIAKPLAAYISANLKDSQPFVDLFCGVCNVSSHIDDKRLRIANDVHKELIALHIAVQQGQELPTSVTAEEYAQIKSSDDSPAWLKGFVGFGLSFSGKWWGGYARSGSRDYCANARNSLLKKHQTLNDVQFLCNDYREVVLPEGALIYCDIPYKDTTQYSVGNFDHQSFYRWAEQRQAEGYDILVSEYLHNLPEGWEVVWRVDSKKDIRNKGGIQEPTTEVLMRPFRKKHEEN